MQEASTEAPRVRAPKIVAEPERPKTIRVLAPTRISSQSGIIVFAKHEIVEDPYLIAMLMGAGVALEPC